MWRRQIYIVLAFSAAALPRKSRWKVVDLRVDERVLVKFHRPVGGALMQCFKAWERTGQRGRGEEEEEEEEGGRRCCGSHRRPPERRLNSQVTNADL